VRKLAVVQKTMVQPIVENEIGFTEPPAGKYPVYDGCNRGGIVYYSKRVSCYPELAFRQFAEIFF
jgi:hypothetical protein